MLEAMVSCGLKTNDELLGTGFLSSKFTVRELPVIEMLEASAMVASELFKK